MSLPLVAIIGRPNVGKSTFINRIAQNRDSIIHPTRGVTRDRNYISSDWQGRNFTLIDTGGIELEGGVLAEEIKEQAKLAMDEAAVIIFLLDRTEGILPEDHDAAELIRKSGKPVIVAVNKIDDPSKHETDILPFYELGLGEPMGVSAVHGIGTGDLLDRLVELLPPLEEEEEHEEGMLSISIVGRPNVGKSSLLNRLLGAERAIVSDIPGTTRDAIDSVVEKDGRKYRLVDTAGIRSRPAVRTDIEYYAYVRTLISLNRSELALLVLDASEGPTTADQKIARLAADRGCAMIVLLNKWDLTDEQKRADIEFFLNDKFHFISFAPVMHVSVKTGYGLGPLFKNINEVGLEFHKRIPTAKLNRFIEEFQMNTSMPSKKGKQLKIKYCTQASSAPPVIVLQVNDSRLVTDGFRRNLLKRIRLKFGFKGTPIILSFRSGS